MWTEDKQQNQGLDVVVTVLEFFQEGLEQEIITMQEAVQTALEIEEEEYAGILRK